MDMSNWTQDSGANLYSAMMGDGNEWTRGVLICGVALGLRGFADVGVYRDAWSERATDGSIRLAVYTRNAGERERYAETTAHLERHPAFLARVVDNLDGNYESYYFALPAVPVRGELVSPDLPSFDEVHAALTRTALAEPRNMDMEWNMRLKSLDLTSEDTRDE